MATESKPLKIIISESTRPIIENIEGKNSSLFSELYDKTFSCIENYLNTVGYGANQEGRSQENIVKTDSPNNIIAFIGERGSGKTSCMLSVAEMLQNKKDGNALKKYEVLNATKFVSVNVIEPSFINDKANVLELVVATLFRNFKEKVEKNAEHIDVKKKHTLLEAFQKVQENMKCLKNGTTELDTIDSLLQLSSGVDLKENMRTLVNAYLEFMNGSQQSILLFPIDDIDLNTKYAYDMVEQIRKYLILPNVLILVSLKLDQLEQVLRNDFTKQFESSLKNKQNEIPLFADIQQMAERYVQKLIPLGHRIFMPDMEAAMDKPIEIICDDNHIHEDSEYDTAKEKTRDFVIFLIKKKTKYRFYNKPGETNLIIPQNLRELVHFISFLWQMQDATQENENIQTRNQSLFRKYFYDIWVKSHLDVLTYNMFHEIFSVRDTKVINATVIKVLRQIIVGENLQDKEIEEIISEKNYSYNISIADVVEVLHFIEQKSCSKEYKILCAAIKVHYDFKLFEFAEELIQRGELYTVKQMTSDDKFLFKDSVLNDFSNYALLIGGKYFHCNNTMIPVQGSSRVEDGLNGRGQRLINGQILREKAKNIVEGKCVDIRVIRLVEFFALNLAIANYDAKQSYRTKRDLWYDVEMPSHQKNIWFDATMFLCNILDMKKAYDRIYPGFYEKVKQNDDLKTSPEEKSLKSQFDMPLSNRKLINDFNGIENLIYYLKSNKPKSEGGSGEGDIKIIKSFCATMAKFQFDERFDLKFVDNFSSCFEEKELFNKIFNPVKDKPTTRAKTPRK